MTFAICLALTLVICLTCDKVIKKYPYVFYIGAALLSIAAYCINTFVEIRTIVPFARDYLIPILTNALFATSFWIIVMWTGALQNGSKLIKKLMPIRGELSITAAILTIGHIVIYGITYVNHIFSGRDIAGDFILFFIVAIILVLIMTPLTIVSIKKIRKKIKGKTWKNIQKAAYIFYALIYFHIVLDLWTKIQIGNVIDSDNILRYIDLVIYTIVFGTYAACRIRKYYILRKKPESKTNINAVSTAAFLACLCLIGIFAFPFSKLGNQENTEVPVVSDVEISDSKISQAEESYENSNSNSSTDENTQFSEEISVIQQSSLTSSQSSKQETSESQTSQTVQQSSEESEPSVVEKPSENLLYNDGIYTGQAYGYDGNIYVTITVSSDKITNITASSDERKSRYFESAEKPVISAIINSQSTNVDAVSGATYSSKGIMQAVQQALNSARI